ncbi:hypothetical protein Chor_017272 [Crotalus horridus]
MSVFVEDVEIVMNDTSEPADVSFVYSGTLQGDAASFCHGSIIHGVFEGFVQTQNGTYYIESAAVVKGPPETHSLIHHQRDLDRRGTGAGTLAPTMLPRIAGYVKAVNAIYEAAEFGRIGTIEFKVKRITIVQEEDPSRTPFLSPEMLLMLHSKTNWDGYCLSYLLTDRDYSGVLGIAFSGQPGETQKKHDQTKECSRFDLNTSRGKFLMFNYATDGTEFNNDKFSPCSIAYISNILEHKKDQCFAETDRPICGNQIVDPGEECDVGSDNEDACCYGAGEPRGIQCRLKPGASCRSR